MPRGRGEGGLAVAPSKDSSLSGIPSGSRVWARDAGLCVLRGSRGRQLREDGSRCLKFESIVPVIPLHPFFRRPVLRGHVHESYLLLHL